VLPPPMPTVSPIKPQDPELAVTSQKTNATNYTLFRPESIEARRMVWLGRPAIALELPAALSSVASVLMVAATIALVALGSYARTIELHGLVLPSSGLIQVTSPAAGWVQSVSVRDGQFVAGGEPLYIVNTDTANNTGNTQQQILQASASWNNYLVDEISAGLRVQKLDLVFGTINTMLFGLDRIVLDRIVIVFFGARAVMSGSLTVGMLVAFLAYKDQFFPGASPLFST
jgi:ABC-type bacteriocin/lantibiotic exporter with double-glycine peptidase domain